MKRYALFIYESHDELGGFNDFQEASDSLEDLFRRSQEILGKKKNIYAHIADLETLKIIASRDTYTGPDVKMHQYWNEGTGEFQMGFEYQQKIKAILGTTE